MRFKFFPRWRDIRRAEARLVGRFFGVMRVITILYVLAVAGHYVTGWW